MYLICFLKVDPQTFPLPARVSCRVFFLYFWRRGEKGYFRIVRGTNECGIESGAVASTATATWSGPGIIA